MFQAEREGGEAFSGKKAQGPVGKAGPCLFASRGRGIGGALRTVPQPVYVLFQGLPLPEPAWGRARAPLSPG